MSRVVAFLVFLVLWPVVLACLYLGALVGGYYTAWRYWRGK